MKRRTSLTTLATLSLIASAGLLIAGPLAPPAGPVTSTYKTLTEVEPRIAISLTNTPGDADSLFRITQPGSYYLTGNITGVSGKVGIEIASHNVTIDLNGLTLKGVAGSLSGISAPAAQNNLVIRNGTVTGWGARGVAMYQNSSGFGALAENLVVSNNVGAGLVAGDNAVIRNCSVWGNTDVGIACLANAVVEECSVYANNSGMILNAGSVIRACTSSQNNSYGIVVTTGCMVTECSVYDNGDVGIHVSNPSLGGSTISRCVVTRNTASGIYITTDCTATDNICDGNGNGGDGAGIVAVGTGNRIEGNICNDADRGIDVDGTNNIIVRNSCSGNTLNWSIVANNVYGPIIDRSAIASASVNGNSATSALGSTDANANFTH